MNKSDRKFFRDAVRQYYPEKHKELYPDEVLVIETKKPTRKTKMNDKITLNGIRKQVKEAGISYYAAMSVEEGQQALDLHAKGDVEGVKQLVQAVRTRYINHRKEQEELKKASESD